MENKVRIECDGMNFEASGDYVATEAEMFIKRKCRWECSLYHQQKEGA